MRGASMLCWLFVLASGVSTPAAVQTPVTLTLRSGEVLAGELLDLGGAGFSIRLPDGMRQIHEDQVTLVSFVALEPITPAELDRLRTSRHLIVLRSGALVGGRLLGISGATPALRLVIEGDGGRREYSSSDVARILLASPAAYTGTAIPAAPIPNPAVAAPPAPMPPASSLPMVNSAGTPPVAPAPPATPGCNPALFVGTWDAGGSWGDIPLSSTGGCGLSGTYTAFGGGRIEGVITGDTFRFSWRRGTTPNGGEGYVKLTTPSNLDGHWCSGNGCDSTRASIMTMTRKGPV